MLRIAAVIPVLVPLSIVGRLPGMSRPVESAYRVVADNRHVISRILDAVTAPIRGRTRSGGS